MENVRTWKAKIVNGRVVLVNDEADGLPEGKELDLREVDADELDESLTAEEEESIRKGLASLDRGKGIPYAEVRAALDRILKS